MKKIILSMAVLACGFANAQEVKEVQASEFGFSKGDVFVEGQLSFSSLKQTLSDNGADVKELKQNRAEFTPKAAYLLTNDLALGVQLTYAGGNGTETISGPPAVTEERTIKYFGAGVFARYYFLELGQRFKTYAEVGVGFGTQKDEVNSNEVSKTNSFQAAVDLGLNYFVTKKIAISFGLADILAFNSSKGKTPDGGENNLTTFNADVNVFKNFFDTPTFGLLYKF